MDHVEQHADAHAVRLVHQVLQIFGVAAARRHRERARHVVPERAVVRVLLHRHQLHGVVPQLLDARQDVVRELAVGVHLRLEAGHAHVRLVDARRGGTLGPRVRARVFLTRGGVPVDAVVPGAHHARLAVGHLDPRRHAVDPLAVALLHADLDPRAVLDGARGQRQGPHAELILLHVVRVGVPAVEVADEARAARRGRPLAVHNLARGRLVESELSVSLGEIQERALGLLDGVLALEKLLPAVFQVALVLEELLVHLRAPHAVHGVPVGAGRGGHRADRVPASRAAREAGCRRAERRGGGLRSGATAPASPRGAAAVGESDGRPHAGGRDRVRNGHRHTNGDRICESRGVLSRRRNPRDGFDESRRNATAPVLRERRRRLSAPCVVPPRCAGRARGRTLTPFCDLKTGIDAIVISSLRSFSS